VTEDELKERRHRYYLNRRDRHRASGKKWAQENKDKVNGYNRKCARKRRELHPGETDGWALNHPEEMADAQRRWVSMNKEKRAAHHALNHAIERGSMTKPDTCPCGAPNPQGHHSDYSKPLMVTWLCVRCHKALHRKED
jgi:hypothetical protein